MVEAAEPLPAGSLGKGWRQVPSQSYSKKVSGRMQNMESKHLIQLCIGTVGVPGRFKRDMAV